MSEIVEFEPKIIAFCCNWCSYAGSDFAGVSRIEYPSNVLIVRVPCSGRIDPAFIIKAFTEGADGVIVAGCHPGDCHYTSGNLFARRKMLVLRQLLKSQGIEEERFALTWISASEGQKFADTVKSIVAKVKKLGALLR